jgi:Protein of unknown function (DUF1688)
MAPRQPHLAIWRIRKGAALTSIDAPTVASLLTADAVRVRSRMIFDAGRRGELAHFALHLDALPACAAFVAETIRQNYPTLRVPPHSRWRHLNANGRDWSERLGDRLSKDRNERARQRIELAVTSVLLDAGAGPAWRWRDPVTGKDFARSEGLALASLEAFRDGLFSSDPAQPCRADAKGLAAVDAKKLSDIFQASDANPLVGIDGRVALLKRLGSALTKYEKIYGAPARVGGLFDHLGSIDRSDDITAPLLLWLLLSTLGSIWPGRLSMDGIQLGDTWWHPAVDVAGKTKGLIPFHKLSQWLTYSLIEPIEEGGLIVDGWDGLTGLAEYRNGGLLIDMGVIVPRDPALPTTPLTPDHEAIVEWRALTVALLDEIAPLVRKELGVTAQQMPLAAILEGGTWAAGRRIAKQKRADGGPPLTIVSDGTVF